jgi:tripartite-type tricarboxylate transporter receptor subunit TctC
MSGHTEGASPGSIATIGCLARPSRNTPAARWRKAGRTGRSAWIVPYTPGGYTDLMARLVGQKISEALGQPIVFENKPGANAIIGTDVVAKAAPDGYTFGTVIAAHAVNATLNPKLPYDTLKDFSYVSLMSVAPLIMIAHPSLPANNVKELIALAKAKPGELNFAPAASAPRRISRWRCSRAAPASTCSTFPTRAPPARCRMSSAGASM